MKWHLSFPIEKAPAALDHRNPVTLLGSCFSAEIGKRLENLGFDTCLNPFGTLFHPGAIARLIERSFDESSAEEQILVQKDLFFSYDANRTVFAGSSEDLKRILSQRRRALRDALASSAALLVTFGTSFCYRHLESGRYVANCHKEPQDLFRKELAEASAMLDTWKRCVEVMRNVNPGIRLIFTVSPVRHVKDGVIENNRSKARLLELAHRLCESVEGAYYFPAYEILLDELRDYRFYANDLLHPSEEAAEYIFERFCATWVSASARQIMDKLADIRSMQKHVSMYPGSLEDVHFRQLLSKKEQAFRKEHPEIRF